METFNFNNILFTVELGTLEQTGKLKFVNPPHEKVKRVIELAEYTVNENAMTITIKNNTWLEEEVVEGSVMIDNTWKRQIPRIYDDQPTEQGIKLYTMYAMLTNQPLPIWEIYRRARINEALENLYKEKILDRFVYCYDPSDNWSYKQPIEVGAVVIDETGEGLNDGSITVTVINPQVGKTYEYSIDGGITWSVNPLFAMLSPNTYNIASKCVEDNFVGHWKVTVNAYVNDVI